MNNKTRVKRAHLKHMHMNKGGSTGQHYGESSYTSSGVSVGVSVHSSMDGVRELGTHRTLFVGL